MTRCNVGFRPVAVRDRRDSSDEPCYGNTIVPRMIWFDRCHLKRRLRCDTLLPKDGNTQTKDEEGGDDTPKFHIGLSLKANGKSVEPAEQLFLSWPWAVLRLREIVVLRTFFPKGAQMTYYRYWTTFKSVWRRIAALFRGRLLSGC